MVLPTGVRMRIRVGVRYFMCEYGCVCVCVCHVCVHFWMNVV